MSKSKNHPNNYVWKENKLILKDECFECGSTKNIHYHHIVPATLGGTKTIPLCVICHGKVHGRDFLKHKELQRIGIERAKLNGVFIGRLKGSTEPVEKFLSKPKIKQSIKLINEGQLSLVEISKKVGVHYNTLTKVKKIMSSSGPDSLRSV